MKILQPIIDQTPVGPRMAQPDEIAYAVAFLCEERARWINGAHIIASGGLLLTDNFRVDGGQGHGDYLSRGELFAQFGVLGLAVVMHIYPGTI
jgi:NAD(P)-dependent dehydrogenase (short-subunit alcohol dehydrogenase family)